MIVCKIGGNSGSGKSTLIKHFLDSGKFNGVGDMREPPKVPVVSFLSEAVVEYVPKYEAYVCPRSDARDTFGIDAEIVILGNYSTACGGMDSITNKEGVRGLIHKWVDPVSPDQVIILEGFIVGKTYGYIGELSERPDQFGKWIYFAFDTSIEVCTKRVTERRRASGNLTEFNNRNLISNFKSIQGAMRKAMEAKQWCVWLIGERSPTEVQEQFRTVIQRKIENDRRA